MSKLNPEVGHYAGAILLTKDNEIILQLRDDKEGIRFPNSLSTFGGGVEGKETPKEAILRELEEEVGGIEIDEEKIEFYKTFYQRLDIHEGVSGDIDCHIFLFKDVDVENLEVYEGQGYVILENFEGVHWENTSPIMREILLTFIEENKQELEKTLS